MPSPGVGPNASGAHRPAFVDTPNAMTARVLWDGGVAVTRHLEPGGRSTSGPARARLAGQRDHGTVRRYLGFALITAIALIAGIGIDYLWFHDEFRSSPVTSLTEARPGDDRVSCQVEGQNLVTVPNLIGKRLPDATARARASGLQLVGTGVSGGDPDGASARVSAQKPPSGIRVPAGACIAFRTRP